MNSIEQDSIPMRDLCPDACLPPTQLKEHTVVNTFAESRLNPRVNAFAKSMLSPEDGKSTSAKSTLSPEDGESRRNGKHACAVCGLVAVPF